MPGHLQAEWITKLRFERVGDPFAATRVRSHDPARESVSSHTKPALPLPTGSSMRAAASYAHTAARHARSATPRLLAMVTAYTQASPSRQLRSGVRAGRLEELIGAVMSCA